jgi:hypothetical protein
MWQAYLAFGLYLIFPVDANITWRRLLNPPFSIENVHKRRLNQKGPTDNSVAAMRILNLLPCTEVCAVERS